MLKNDGIEQNTTHDIIPGNPGFVKVKSIGNSSELRRRLVGKFNIPLHSYSEEDRNKIKKIIQKTKITGYEAQHIIPVQMKNHPAIVNIGMDMNHAQNGIFLPIPSERAHALSTHRGYHKIYNVVVKEQLDAIISKAGENASVEEISREVAILQRGLKVALEQGLPMYAKKANTRGVEIHKRGGGASKELWHNFLNDYKSHNELKKTLVKTNLKNQLNNSYKGVTSMSDMTHLTEESLRQFEDQLYNFINKVEKTCLKMESGVLYCKDAMLDQQCAPIIRDALRVIENIRTCISPANIILTKVQEMIEGINTI